MIRIPAPPNRIKVGEEIVENVLYVRTIKNTGICEAIDMNGFESSEDW